MSRNPDRTGETREEPAGQGSGYKDGGENEEVRKDRAGQGSGYKDREKYYGRTEQDKVQDTRTEEKMKR